MYILVYIYCTALRIYAQTVRTKCTTRGHHVLHTVILALQYLACNIIFYIQEKYLGWEAIKKSGNFPTLGEGIALFKSNVKKKICLNCERPTTTMNELIPERNDIPDRNEFIPNRNEIILDRYWNLGS